MSREETIKGLEEFIHDLKPFCGNQEDWKKVYAALALLKEQETKHGEWLESKILEDCFWVCSECEFPSEAFAAPTLYKYCPNCGVKMDRR